MRQRRSFARTAVGAESAGQRFAVHPRQPNEWLRSLVAGLTRQLAGPPYLLPACHPTSHTTVAELITAKNRHAGPATDECGYKSAGDETLQPA